MYKLPSGAFSPRGERAKDLSSRSLRDRFTQSYFWKKMRDERGFVALLPADLIDFANRAKDKNDPSVLDVPLPTKDTMRNQGWSWQLWLVSMLRHENEFVSSLMSGLTALQLHNTHADIAFNALSGLHRAYRWFDPRVVMEYSKQPDLKAMIDDINSLANPKEHILHGAMDQFYNPSAKPTEEQIKSSWESKTRLEDGDYKGKGKDHASHYYEILVAMLQVSDKASGSKNLSSKYAGALSHYLSDIIIPYHALGRREGDVWVAPNSAEHGILEIAFSLKRYWVEGITPHYIERGVAGIEERFEREAMISHQLAKKAHAPHKPLLAVLFGERKAGPCDGEAPHSFAERFIKNMTPFSEDEMVAIHRRAVQLVTDVFYTALIDSGQLPKPGSFRKQNGNGNGNGYNSEPQAPLFETIA